METRSAIIWGCPTPSRCEVPPKVPRTLWGAHCAWPKGVRPGCPYQDRSSRTHLPGSHVVCGRGRSSRGKARLEPSPGDPKTQRPFTAAASKVLGSRLSHELGSFSGTDVLTNHTPEHLERLCSLWQQWHKQIPGVPDVGPESQFELQVMPLCCLC